MKKREELKKYRSMVNKKLAQKAKTLQESIQSIKVNISVKKTTAFDKSKKEKIRRAQVLTIINEKSNLDDKE